LLWQLNQTLELDGRRYQKQKRQQREKEGLLQSSGGIN